MKLVLNKPSKIIGIAVNYEGATGLDDTMSEPLIFLKGSNTFLNNNEKIKIPFNLPCWGEVELGVVISKKAKNISIDEVESYILGYTIVNDITIKNIDNRDHHLARSKSVDNFCPVLDTLDTSFIPKDQKLKAFHNGILLREGKISDMIWSPEKIVSEVSHWMTLEKGDLILTGTPPRVKERMFLKNNDTFLCEIEGLGKLENEFYE